MKDGRADKKLDYVHIKIMRYTQEQISTALLLLKATGSPNKVIETLGSPSSPMLYLWRDSYPEYYDVHQTILLAKDSLDS